MILFECWFFFVEFDLMYFEMVIMNVFINLCDVMLEGGKVYIFIELWKFNGNVVVYYFIEGDYVVFIIKDEGEGMFVNVFD